MSAEATDVLRRCQAALPGWRGLDLDDFEFADPKGFSSFTMGVRCRVETDPPAVLYRHLEGKENAILEFAAEKHVYETLAEAGVAASTLAYDPIHRIEQFYPGRTLTREDLNDHDVLRGIGAQLACLHRLAPQVPSEPFFDLLHAKWGKAAEQVLTDQRHLFPENEQAMCDELLAIVGPDTLDRVHGCVPAGPLSFSHNDTYHGNIMLLDSGEIRLLDFEFSCLNHRVFDFSNLFAETVMRHKLPSYPFFDIAEPEYRVDDVAALVDAYLAAGGEGTADALVRQTMRMVPLSDFMYAMAALPLAVEPIQKIRFIPYALRRFRRFLASSAP